MSRILVVCGGDNSERRVSLAGGDAVARGLAAAGHQVLKLDTAVPARLVNHDVPLLDGPVGMAPPDEAVRAKLNRDGWLTLFDALSDPRFDAVFPLLHGTWGEGGQIQATLELLGVPFLGCGMLASALALDKYQAHLAAERAQLPVARARLFHHAGMNASELDAALAFTISATTDPDWGHFSESHPHPVVLKPNLGGSTVGITISNVPAELRAGLNSILEMPDDPLLEEYVPGREVTVAILGDQALPIIEIVPHAGFYDYTNKYTKGRTDYLCPAPVNESVQRQAAEFATAIFHELGCRHLARVDFRLTGDNRLIFLEVNTIPGMTDLSLVPMAAKQAGLDFPALMNRFVELVIDA